VPGISLLGQFHAVVANQISLVSCQVILAALKGLSDLGTTVLVDTLTEVCKLSGVSLTQTIELGNIS
jgi:hypothetical protein